MSLTRCSSCLGVRNYLLLFYSLLILFQFSANGWEGRFIVTLNKNTFLILFIALPVQDDCLQSCFAWPNVSLFYFANRKKTNYIFLVRTKVLRACWLALRVRVNSRASVVSSILYSFLLLILLTLFFLDGIKFRYVKCNTILFFNVI